ncbi:MAG TPA: hypothetical protein PK747_04095 [Acidobacteriota bacterium]|nr:hypothetical protein [Acidobacteriota bacterium]HNT17734.1 hypothetical protein [Acidobacteriota bacterium]HQO19092.1 hypothetical protein [Acidobacteriota bacterium]HQQ46574.1 hypothetical protein [Acidobacteriota bacterium]
MKKTAVFLLFVGISSFLLHAQTPSTTKSCNGVSLIMKTIEETGKARTYSRYKKNLDDLKWEEAPIECMCNFCPDIYCHPEIPKDIRNSLSSLNWNNGLEDYCYKATQKTTSALILRYFYTDFSFEKVEPRLQRTVIAYKDENPSLKDLTDEVVKRGAVLEDWEVVNRNGQRIFIHSELKISGMSVFLFHSDNTTAALIYSDHYFLKIDKQYYPEDSVAKCRQHTIVRWVIEAKNELEKGGYKFHCETEHMYLAEYGLAQADVSLRNIKEHLQQIREWRKTGDPRIQPLLFLTGTFMIDPITETEYMGYEFDVLGAGYFKDSRDEKTYCSSFSVLKELIKDYRGTKWGERAVIVNAMFGFGECDIWDCAYYKKVIAEFPGFLSKCRDRDALIMGTFFIGAAYETQWCSSKTQLVPLVHDPRDVPMPCPEECRGKAIEAYKNVLKMDRESCFTPYLKRTLPMLYLNICTGANFFVIFVD